MVRPTDTLYSSQWHFALIGNIEAIWPEFTGSAVAVGVYDDGVDAGHEDLVANYDMTRQLVDGSGAPLSGLPLTDDEGHGTACAGIIGAARNGYGGVGVAYGVSITGVNIDYSDVGLYGSINALDPSAFFEVVRQGAGTFDVMSNSWSAWPGFLAENSLTTGSFGAGVGLAYEYVSEVGRGGLGTIVVQSAGNDALDSNGFGVNTSRHSITVSATGSDGFVASYSNYGACVLIAAPAASVTTDRMGIAGYSDGNYMTDFDGTSAACPVVSGVVALMLDANPNLGWRDVQNILANSATLTGSGFGDIPSVNEVGSWSANAGTIWNGGGNHIHADYGYGMVNAFNAVRMAEVWTLFAPSQTSANEATVTTGLVDFQDFMVPDNDTAGVTRSFTLGDGICVEHVAVTLDFVTTAVGDLRIKLTSAEGTEIVLCNASGGLSADYNGTWVFGADTFRNESSAGTWTLTLIDAEPQDLVTVRSARIDLYGAAVSVNDVHHFTDEFAAMARLDSGRATISDTNGGIDWLNMAAVAADVVLNLASGRSFSFDKVVLGTLAGVFENIVTGDGFDWLTGTTGGNNIRTMRGNDTLNGGGGADTLAGGAGSDLYYTDGGDRISEGMGQGTDTVRSSVSLSLAANVERLVLTGTASINATGNGLANILTGTSGKNVLNGGAGSDILRGGVGQDTFVFNSALGRTNIDSVQDFSVRDDTFRLENAIFKGLASGTLATSAFASNLSGLAGDRSDRIVYERDTGRLYFDADGTGSAARVHFATVDAGLAMTHSDFFVF